MTTELPTKETDCWPHPLLRACPNGCSDRFHPLMVRRHLSLSPEAVRGMYQAHCYACGWSGPAEQTFEEACRAARPELDAGDLVRAL
jgi:hypothetical protein